MPRVVLAMAMIPLLASPAQDKATTFEKVEIAGIENAFRLSPRLYSGSQPEGAKSFEALKAMGVKTIVTVDGAQPDVETARRYGMRYVHLPVGYDGVTGEVALKLAKAARTLPGPIFVHCHHGLHRGPAAAAVCGKAVEGWDDAKAMAWLKEVGTSPNYPGLFATVRKFRTPSAEEVAKAGDLPEKVEVPGLVESMIEIDAIFDRLKAAKVRGFRPPADRPDLLPADDATLLFEGFVEVGRRDEAKTKGAEFLRLLGDAEARARDLDKVLREPGVSKDRTEAAFTAATKSCTACHAKFRDR